MNADDSSDVLGFDLPDTDSNENMTTSDDEKSPVPWASLPSIPLENIYSYLNREDQRRMSMVCRNWNEEYGCPSLWRNFQFLLPEDDLNLETYLEVELAREHGHFFRHVEIACRRVRRNNIEIIRKQLKLFLQTLTLKSHLESVKFLHMKKYFRLLDHEMSNDVFQTIKNFFSSQHRLKTVEFRNAEIKKSEAAKILKVIFFHNSKSLQNLRLDAFTKNSNYGAIEENVVSEAVIFESLLCMKSLKINYSHVFENIMMSFYEYAQNLDTRRIKGNLELMDIFCDGSEEIYYQTIPPECWQLITLICPSLRVNLTYHLKRRFGNGFPAFVARNMPLKELDFRWDSKFHSLSEAEIRFIFQYFHSCGTNEHLEVLKIVWFGKMNNLAADVMNFLEICEELKVFQLCIEHPVESLDAVFDSWLDEKSAPSLQDVRITVENVRSTEEELIYSRMADQYRPLLSQTRGLNLLLNCESNTRPRRP